MKIFFLVFINLIWIIPFLIGFFYFISEFSKIIDQNRIRKKEFIIYKDIHNKKHYIHKKKHYIEFKQNINFVFPLYDTNKNSNNKNINIHLNLSLDLQNLHKIAELFPLKKYIYTSDLEQILEIKTYIIKEKFFNSPPSLQNKQYLKKQIKQIFYCSGFSLNSVLLIEDETDKEEKEEHIQYIKCDTFSMNKNDDIDFKNYNEQTCQTKKI